MEQDLFYFNTSAEDFCDRKLTDITDVGEKLYESIQKILDTRFPNDSQEKRTIKSMNKGYKIACPYCGDSHDDPSKKRGNIYLEDRAFKCWNGGCYAYKPLNVLLSDFDANDFSFSERENFMVQHVITNSSNKKSLAEFYNSDVMFDKDEILRALKAKPIKNSIEGLRYLEGRNVFGVNLDDMAYNSYYGNLIFLNMFEGKVLGIQMRLGKPMKNGTRFISYNYEDIYKELLKKEYDVNFAKSLNKVSLIYNILNINFQLPVNVFESTINSKYFSNVIALWGASNDIDIKNGYYYFDNDVAGKKASIKAIDRNNNVFLWRRFLKDFNQYKDCSDINDIFKLNPRFNKNVLLSYFGNSKFDKMDL